MILTSKNAQDYVGKFLYSNKPLFHYYPLKVSRLTSGGYAVTDRTGTMMLVGDSPFNSYQFDYVKDYKNDEKSA